MNRYQEDYEEFINDLKYIDELINGLTIEQRKALGAKTWSIQGILGRYINEEKDSIKELVDKETPMKPIQKPIGTLGLEIDLCICGTLVNSGRQSRCSECGQAIDWSNDNG